MIRQPLPLPSPCRGPTLALARRRRARPLGVLMVYSASSRARGRALLERGDAAGGIRVIGVAAMLVAARLDYRLLGPLAAVIYGGALLLLAAVLVIG